MEISQNFVAISECMNFKVKTISDLKACLDFLYHHEKSYEKKFFSAAQSPKNIPNPYPELEI